MLILTRDSVLDLLGEVTVAPITRTVRDLRSEVPVGVEDGMPHDGAINLDHVATIDRGKIGALITTLPPAKMEQVRSALVFALGFERPTRVQ